MSEHVSSHRLTSSCALPTLPATVSHLIQIRAHELYELRCKRDGHALEDWLQAESEILSSASRDGQQQFRDFPATAPTMLFHCER